MGVRLLVGSEAVLTQVHSDANVSAHKLTDFIQPPNVNGLLSHRVVEFHDTTRLIAVLCIPAEPDESVIVQKIHL